MQEIDKVIYFLKDAEKKLQELMQHNVITPNSETLKYIKQQERILKVKSNYLKAKMEQENQ